MRYTVWYFNRVLGEWVRFERVDSIPAAKATVARLAKIGFDQTRIIDNTTDQEVTT